MAIGDFGTRRGASVGWAFIAAALLVSACTAPSHYSSAEQRALLGDPKPAPRPATAEAETRTPEAIEAASRRPPLPPSPPQADKVVVQKAERQLLLMNEGHVFARYPIALGSNPLGHKRKRGDGRTPEGRYVLDWRNDESSFYRSIHISYPAPRDRRRAATKGVDPGDAIMIHGLPDKYRWMGPHHTVADWTNGCIAVTNAQIDRIWKRVPDGTPILIHP